MSRIAVRVPKDPGKGEKPLLNTFLSQRTSYDTGFFDRNGSTVWNDDDGRLCRELMYL